MRPTVLLSLALLLPGSALAQSAQTAQAPVNPVGTWDLQFMLHGQSTEAVLSITRDDEGNLKARFDVHGQQVELKAAAVKDRVITFGNGLDINLTLSFTGPDALTGTWERPEASGSLSGTRRKS